MNRSPPAEGLEKLPRSSAFSYIIFWEVIPLTLTIQLIKQSYAFTRMKENLQSSKLRKDFKISKQNVK